MSSSVNRLGKLACCTLIGFIASAEGWALVVLLHGFCLYATSNDEAKSQMLLVVLMGMILATLFAALIPDDVFTEG